MEGFEDHETTYRDLYNTAAASVRLNRDTLLDCL